MEVLNVRDNETSYSVKVALGDDGEIIVEDIGHEKLHDAKAWIGESVNESVASDTYAIMGLIVGGEGCPEILHAHFRIGVGADAITWLYELCTISGGVEIPLVNRNRMLRTALEGVTLVCNPTLVSSGTCLKKSFIPGGTRKQVAEGGNFGESNGWVLRQPATYCVVVRNDGAGAEPISLGVTIADESTEEE